MITVCPLTEYDADVAARMSELLKYLSTHYEEGYQIEREWIEEVIDSPLHDFLLAYDDNDKIVAMASMAVVKAMGSQTENVGYLEGLVVDGECQGQGVGSKMWDAIVEWSKAHNCGRIEFTSSGKGEKKQNAIKFYLSKGAEIRETNAFRYVIE